MYRSIFLELVPTFMGSLAVGVGALLLGVVRKLSSRAVSGVLSIHDIAWLLLYSLPKVVAATIPFVLVITTFVVVSRQSINHEYGAWRACGVTVWQYTGPFVIFGSLVALFAATISLWIEPAANRNFNLLRERILQRGIQQLLKPNQLNFNHPRFIFYTNNQTEQGHVENLLMVERNLPRILAQTLPSSAQHANTNPPLNLALSKTAMVVYAFQAKVQSPPNENVRIDLQGGHLVLFGQGLSSVHDITFERSQQQLTKTFASRLNLGSQHAESNAELLARIWAKDDPATYQKALAKLNFRIIIPLACISFALVSVPMAITDPRAHRAYVAARGITLVLVYYLAWAGFKDLVIFKQANPTLLHIPWFLIFCYGLLRTHLQNQSGGISPWRRRWQSWRTD